MCLGTPMQVLDCSEHYALCQDGSAHTQVDISLVGPQPQGTWLLVFLGAAREVMSEEEALHTRNALQAVSDVMQGHDDVNHLFADLVDREPQLPPHLQHNQNQRKQDTKS